MQRWFINYSLKKIFFLTFLDIPRIFKSYDSYKKEKTLKLEGKKFYFIFYYTNLI